MQEWKSKKRPCYFEITRTHTRLHVVREMMRFLIKFSALTLEHERYDYVYMVWTEMRAFADFCYKYIIAIYICEWFSFETIHLSLK